MNFDRLPIASKRLRKLPFMLRFLNPFGEDVTYPEKLVNVGSPELESCLALREKFVTLVDGSNA